MERTPCYVLTCRDRRGRVEEGREMRVGGGGRKDEGFVQ